MKSMCVLRSFSPWFVAAGFFAGFVLQAWAQGGTGVQQAPSAPQAAAPPVGNSTSLATQTITVALPKQPWQERSEKFWATVKGVNAGNADAWKEMDAIVAWVAAQPFARTPMENMDILGAYFVPKQGVEPTLPWVVANAALGWYDALRFGSASGRDEILQKHRFFVRAYVLPGAKTTGQFKQFMTEHPDLAQQAVAKGLSFAERERINPHYEVHWPTAYGLERIICAQGGSCEPPKAMPSDQWDNAWAQAKQRVTNYYSVPIEKPK